MAYDKKGYYIAMTKLGTSRHGDAEYYRKADKLKEREFLEDLCRWSYLNGRNMDVATLSKSLPEFFSEKIKKARRSRDPLAFRRLTSYGDCANEMFDGQHISLSEMGLYASLPVTCPDCGIEALYANARMIYGRNYGMRYICPACGKNVGVHRGTPVPLGTLADRELKTERQQLHFKFDRLWKEKGMTRDGAYSFLSSKLGLPPEKTHIGMFDREQCGRAMRAINAVMGRA